MEGNKITQLKDALKSMLGELGKDDAFTVIEFADRNTVSNHCNGVLARSDPADCQ